MPLTSKGEEILSAFRAEYGATKGEEYFYVARNKGSISGVDSAGATTRFYEDRQISANRGLTREGFMICRDCAIARIGRYIYSKDELPGLRATRDGIIYVDRTEDEVFSEKSMRSFEGKPITIDHPPEDVTPDNWKDYAVGTVFNVRRGRGTMADSLVADLLLTDAAAIRIVKANDKTELSCGYDAQYHQVADGRGSQTNIVGNHVAIVDNGRCGGACRIGDSAMSTWKDRLRAAFTSRSLDDFEKVMKEKKDDDAGGGGAGGAADDGKGAAADDGKGGGASGAAAADPGADDGGKGGTHHHITVNVGSGAAADPAAAGAAGAAGASGAAGAAGAGAGAAAEDTDPISVIVNAITALAARIEALEQKINGGGGATTDPDAAAAAAAAGQTGASGGGQTQDRAGVKTVDAKTIDAITAELNEAVSFAEILRPGIKPPTLTLDAKMDVAKTRDSICAFRRRTMEEAFDDTKSARAFDGLIKDKAEIKTMTCDAAKVLFVASTAKMRDINNASLHAAGGGASQVKSGPRTIAEVNAANCKFHAEAH